MQKWYQTKYREINFKSIFYVKIYKEIILNIWRNKMNSYIKQWLEIIENMNNDNTYKLAWGRAIIELCLKQIN